MKYPIDSIIIIREQKVTRAHINRWQGSRKIYRNITQSSLKRINACSDNFDKFSFEITNKLTLVALSRITAACREYNASKKFVFIK